MKSHNKHPHSLSQLQLQFKAVSVSFKNNYLNRSFKMYLQRQAQIIGELKALFSQSRLNQDFVFPDHQSAIPFRIIKLVNSVYQIALYQVDAYDQEKFLQLAQLNLTKFIEDYQKQLFKCQQDLWNQLSKDSEKTSVPQIWRALSNNFTRKTFSSAIKFKNVEVIIQVNVTATNKYDKQVKLDDQIQKKKKEEKKAARQKCEFGRSKTAPSFPQITLAPQPQHQFQSEVILLNKKGSLQADFGKKQEATLITSLSIPSLKFNLNKIQEVQQTENQATDGNHQQKKSVVKNQHNFYHGTQQLKQQSQQFQKNAEKKIEAQNSQFYAIHTAEGSTPQIQVKAFRVINNVEPTEGYENVRSLFMESGVQPKETAEQPKTLIGWNVLIWFYLLGFIVLIYWLMHPLSRL